MMDELKELKAKAYDLLAVIEGAQFELRQINLKIAELEKVNGKVIEVK